MFVKIIVNLQRRLASPRSAPALTAAGPADFPPSQAYRSPVDKHPEFCITEPFQALGLGIEEILILSFRGE